MKINIMASELDIFSISGPTYLTSVNWKCPHHQRAVAASLVQGVYILERDRQQNSNESNALAPPWWQFFNFELIRKLVDDADFSIFGAIYEFKPFVSLNESSAFAPKYVIAFRGTITEKDSINRDLALDFQLIQNGLHRASRSVIAIQAVRNIVSVASNANVWLTGHSLGSAMATLTGRNIAKMGVFLQTFLFNPPFFSAPIESIKDKRVKLGIRIATSVITAGLSFAMKRHQERTTVEDPFAYLASWVPNIFVIPGDHICSEYIGYFEHRKVMEEMGAGIIERLATQHSIGDLFLTALGKESDPLHLLPSADMTINLSPSPDFKSAHGIHQWWRVDLHLQSKQYRYV